MIEEKIFPDTPLSLQELEKIEQTNLSGLDRHYLRLMAHCLGCFQAMADGSSKGPLPKKNLRLKWCLNQPGLANDSAFISTLLEQFTVAEKQLEKLAEVCGISPLELTVDDLITASLKLQSSDLL